MKLLMTPMIPAPRYVGDPPKNSKSVKFSDLLTAVGLTNRVTGGRLEVLVHSGSDHFWVRDQPCVGLSGRLFAKLTYRNAGFILEVLAHGFHDYTARENICGRLRYHPDYRGHERTGKAMSGAERARKFRMASKRN